MIEPQYKVWRCPTCGADYHDPPGEPPRCMFDRTELVPDDD